MAASGFQVLSHSSASAPLDPEKWYAIYTSPRHEKSAAKHFHLREVECFLPLYASLRRWNNRCKVQVESPLFPSYLFVKLLRRDWVRALEVPGVLSIVGSGREPSPLPASEIEALRAGLSQRDFEPHPYLVAGEKVRITAGPFAGMAGIILRKKSSFRVVITLQQIMQSVAVEVDVDEVERDRS
jgi:transcription antitermination factor NusG